MEYKGILCKDISVGHNDTTLNSTGLYTHEDSKWFYDNNDTQFDNGDMFSVFTYYKYSEPYIIRYYNDVFYLDKMEIKSSRFNIYVPTNGTPPYYIEQNITEALDGDYV